MSHFTVTVRLPAATPRAEINTRVGEMLAPYCEHTEHTDRFHVEFVDSEAEYLEEYASGAVEMARCEDGSLVYTWDERFKPKTRDLFARAEAPAHLERVQVAHRERFATFEQFVAEWHGDKERDERKGRFGYWRNPRAKWDWWCIGGRWRGNLLVKSPSKTAVLIDTGEEYLSSETGLGEVSWVFTYSEKPVPGSLSEVDWCRIRDLDCVRIANLSRQKASEFWAQVDAFLSGKKFNDFVEGPRDAMLALGMLDCKDANALTGTEFWKSKWDRQITPGVDRFDVVAEKPNRERDDAKVLAFCDPIRPWAFLDESGWHERGKMGWFGFGGDTPESNEKFVDQFAQWLAAGDSADWIVTVDCHI